ncbi:MAG: trigger factor, partial [Firmicutes bacterium]|nr:trigger factor [Bacillota bacterium]
MQFKFTEGEQNTILMEVEIPYEEMLLPMKKKVKEYAQRVNIPGFRKGKAPAQVIESYIGVQNIMNEAAQDLLAEKYGEEIDKQEFEPIAAPKIEVEQLEKNKPVIIKGTIAIKPPVKLGKYKGVEVTKRTYKVGDVDVEQEVQNQLARVGKLVDAPRKTVTENGHIVNLDFSGEVGGEFFNGGSGEDYPLQLGSGSFIPGFEEQLVGLKIGDTKDVHVTFPANYGEESLAGKDAIFHCKIKNIRVRELPELNDDLVKDLSETAETVAEWKEQVRQGLQDEADQAADNEVRNAVIDIVAQDVEVEIPMLMAEPRVSQMYEDLSKRLDEQDIDIKDYLKYMKTDLFGLRKEFRKQAEADIKIELMLQAIAKKEQLEMTQEEIDKEVAELADYYMMGAEEYKQQLVANDQMHFIYDKILLEKAAQFVYDNAVIKVEEYDAESVKKLMEEQEQVKPEVVAEKPKKKTTKKAAAEGEEKPAKKTTKKSAAEGEEKPAKKT